VGVRRPPNSYDAVHQASGLARQEEAVAPERADDLTAAGWITRFRPRLSKGKHEWVYELARKGFELGRN
jgi:hypothetical protein